MGALAGQTTRGFAAAPKLHRMSGRLTYTAFDEPLPRHELVPDGRRLAASGGILTGALHTLGYYSTDVCLGVPGKRYDLIIDTGSSITAVPCSGCRQCGSHKCGAAGYFDTRASPSSRTVSCRASSGSSCSW